MFDEFVIDVSLSVMIKQRDMLTMLKGLEDKLDLIGWINDILWNWANENVGKNWWLVGRWADIESLPNFEDLKEWSTSCMIRPTNGEGVANGCGRI